MKDNSRSDLHYLYEPPPHLILGMGALFILVSLIGFFSLFTAISRHLSSDDAITAYFVGPPSVVPGIAGVLVGLLCLGLLCRVYFSGKHIILRHTSIIAPRSIWSHAVVEIPYHSISRLTNDRDEEGYYRVAIDHGGGRLRLSSAYFFDEQTLMDLEVELSSRVSLDG